VEFLQGNRLDDLLALWYKGVRVITLIIFPAFVFCFLMAETLITFLYTDAYAGSTPIFQLYLLVLPLTIANFGSLLRATKFTKYIFYASFLSLVLGTLFSLILVRIMGTLGPAVAILVTSLIGFGYYATSAKKALDIELKRLMPWKTITQIGLIALLAGLLSYPLLLLSLPKLAALLLVGALYAVVYLGFLVSFRILKVEDKAVLRRWLTLEALRPQKN
jgi:O-antigen/teichoic acid export membrane protein